MTKRRVTYGQLREVLTGLGFEETRRPNGVGLEHPATRTLFLFRPYEDTEKVQPAEVAMVSEQLEGRGLLEAALFETLLSMTPAS